MARPLRPRRRHRLVRPILCRTARRTVARRGSNATARVRRFRPGSGCQPLRHRVVATRRTAAAPRPSGGPQRGAIPVASAAARAGLVDVRCSVRCAGGHPQNGPAALGRCAVAATPAVGVETRRNAEPVVPVAIVIADCGPEQLPHRPPWSPHQVQRFSGSTRKPEREVDADQRRADRASGGVAISASATRRVDGFESSMPPASATAIHTESAPVVGELLALQSTTTMRSNSTGRSQARTELTAAKCSAAASTVNECHTSW